MTFQIAKSVISGLPYDYAGEVEKFRQAKLAHRFTGDIAPSAPAIIEHAVKRLPVEGEADDFVIDYEVIDDVPVPTLEERKAKLINEIRTAEAAAHLAIISPARERLMYLDLAPVHHKSVAERSPTETELLARAQGIADRKSRVQRHAIGQEIEVEDLTAETIDGWQPAAFPGD